MKQKIYDLHITVDPRTFDSLQVKPPWQVHDIENVQGIPHLIVSQKYSGHSPHREIRRMAQKLRSFGVAILRKKIELHFRDICEVPRTLRAVGIIEVHYKYRQRGTFSVNPQWINELNLKKFALSFNRTARRPIISLRWNSHEAYEQGKMKGALLPFFIEEEERELVVMDSNRELDSFWPLRTADDEPPTFRDFPHYISRVPLNIRQDCNFVLK